MTIKTGTRIELKGTPAMGGFPGVAPERAVIARPRKSNLPLRDGYHLVQFADGCRLCIHADAFRVLDSH